jgi:hypothetical protein
MKLGFSLSPGGLLFPYHLGVMDCLEYCHYLKPTTPLAGSSAGAIAVATKGCGIASSTALQATIDMSDSCHELGGARGRLIPLLQDQLHRLIGPEQFEHLQERQGSVGIAYRELFPYNRPVVETDFETSCDLKRAVCHSSTFPFFSTNWPVALDWSTTTVSKSSSGPTTTTLSSSSSPLPLEIDDSEKKNSNNQEMAAAKSKKTMSMMDLKIPRVLVDGFFYRPTCTFRLS